MASGSRRYPFGLLKLALSGALTLGLLGGGLVLAEPADACKRTEERRGKCGGGGDDDGEQDPGSPPQKPRPGDYWVEEDLRSSCDDADEFCSGLYNCSNDGEHQYNVWLRRHTYDGQTWEVGDWYRDDPFVQCRGPEDDALDEATVRAAVEAFGLPSATLEMNPVDQHTLIHLRSIFHCEADTTSFALDVGGTTVQITATPVEYRWDFGDGNGDTTTHPGTAWTQGGDWSDYIVHTYEATGTHTANVDIAYEVAWDAGDGPNTISDPILGEEPPGVDIEVVESRAVLNE